MCTIAINICSLMTATKFRFVQSHMVGEMPFEDIILIMVRVEMSFEEFQDMVAILDI